MNKDICIYHGNCADGFGSAWVVRQYCKFWDLPMPEFFAGVHGQPAPNVTGRNVTIVDFSYKRPALLEMAEQAESILIIDHHKTAAEDLVDLPENVTTVFDMNHSGAILAWSYFFSNSEPPFLLRHIEDRDLWKFELAGTRQIQATIFSYPYDFEVWDQLVSSFDEFGGTPLTSEGEAIERKHHKDVDELLKVTTREMVIGGHKVLIANLPYTLVSDAAHELAKNRPFAGCYWDTPTGRTFGLRSSDSGIDVSSIAKQYGGGGHEHASGFTVSYEQARDFELINP